MARTWKHISSRAFPHEIPVRGRFFERRFQPLSVGGFFSKQRESISRCPTSIFPSKTQNRQIARTADSIRKWLKFEKLIFNLKTILECSTLPNVYCLKFFWRDSVWFHSYACSKPAVAECSFVKAGLDDPSVLHHCCQDGEEVGVVGRWQSRRRTRVCGHRPWHSQFGYNPGHLGDKTLLEKGLPCVTGNDNELEQHAVVHLPQSKVFWDLCGHDVRCPNFSALQKWAY